MNYRFYTTKKEPIYPPSLKWMINQLSYISLNVKNKKLMVDKTLKSDLREVLKELNYSINELLGGE